MWHPDMPEEYRNQIVTGEALEVMVRLPDANVDAVVTDPPYCSGGFSEQAKRQANGQGLRSETIRSIGWFINDNMGTAGLVWLLRSVAVQAARVLRDAGSLLVFTDWRMLSHLAPALESSGLRLQSLVVWDKGTAGLGWGFRAQHEMILHYVKGTGRFYDMATGNVLTVPRVPVDDREHQTEKPVPLVRRLCRVVVPPDGVVLDPFCGSGTIGVVSRLDGYNYIGVELDPVIAATARERIANTQPPLPGLECEQLPLIEPALSQP